MLRRITPVLALVGAVTVLVLAANTVAMAATGQGFLLGKSNSAGTVTGLTRTTDGSVLKLTSKSSVSAPLTVNGKGKVTNLHADKLDGLDAAALGTKSYVYTAEKATPGNSFIYAVTPPAGTYLINYSAYLVGVSDTDVYCFVSDGTNYVAQTRFRTPLTDSVAGIGSSGYLRISGGEQLILTCGADEAFTVTDYEPIQLIATRITSAVEAAPVSLP